MFGLHVCGQESKSVVLDSGMEADCSSNILDDVHMFVGIPRIPRPKSSAKGTMNQIALHFEATTHSET